MNSSIQGDIGEAYAAAKMLEKEWVVLKPIGDNRKYDLVIDRGLGFEKVQVKSTQCVNGCLIAATLTLHNTTKKSKAIQYTLDEVDLFCIYDRESRNLYLVDAKEYTEDDDFTIRKCIRLRIDMPKNNQTKGVVWAKDYILK
jgi:hypothetical protein